jgi:hypothetical protein
LDPDQSFTVIKQIHNHVMPLKIPIQPIHTHCIPMHMTLFISSYANSYHSTNGLERTPSHKLHVDQRLTPIPTYCCDKSKWHSTLGSLHREKTVQKQNPYQYIYDDHVFDTWQNLEEVEICQSTIAEFKLQCMVLPSRIVISMNSRNWFGAWIKPLLHQDDQSSDPEAVAIQEDL